MHWFTSLEDARRTIENWRKTYHEMRPHSSLVPLTAREYLAQVKQKLDITPTVLINDCINFWGHLKTHGYCTSSKHLVTRLSSP